MTCMSAAVSQPLAATQLSTWSALGVGPNTDVFALAVSGNDVYAAGSFTLVAGAPASRIAKWDGTNWSTLGSGLNFTARAVAVVGKDLYVGGDLMTAGGKVSVNL